LAFAHPALLILIPAFPGVIDSREFQSVSFLASGSTIRKAFDDRVSGGNGLSIKFRAVTKYGAEIASRGFRQFTP
jgi:hypothetical protein